MILAHIDYIPPIPFDNLQDSYLEKVTARREKVNAYRHHHTSKTKQGKEKSIMLAVISFNGNMTPLK